MHFWFFSDFDAVFCILNMGFVVHYCCENQLKYSNSFYSIYRIKLSIITVDILNRILSAVKTNIIIELLSLQLRLG